MNLINLFEEQIRLEQLAKRVEREKWARESASDEDAINAEARNKQAERADPREVK